MLTFLPPALRGSLAAILIVANTVACSIPLFAVALLKAVLPLRGFRIVCSRVLNGIVSFWISINNIVMKLCSPMAVSASGIETLQGMDPGASFLVTSNHQSWADIVLVQILLNRKVPQLKFFLKQELIWVPVLGLCWWALDFPFMKRHTKEYLAKHPEKKGEDLKTTRKACEKFKDSPVCIYNFVEGTRFTPAKHKRQGSPYKYLLKPKSGGVGFVMGAMGDKIKHMINITIEYRDQAPSFWEFLCGRCPSAHLHVELVKIPEEFLGRNYMEDREFRADIQKWVNVLWEEKDRFMDRQTVKTEQPQPELTS
ncbi:acyltransferase [Parendozoicomonas haliclonae]|uniref:Putative acyltransferase YihG n=1 Tax=Parendozoicomonas haliclonae TaxID=1960125 RepID=A0A1X7AQL3_9GAMM|nr:acyltransferase [Parendozoicomonas haliclonae]SMA50388.1 putative acyltransferase YihG [Parendozoicomonas haliclonae]